MRHMRSRRILAMLLALSMIFGLLTTTAFAGEVDQNPSNVGESAANGTSESGSGEGQSSGASDGQPSQETNKKDVPTEEETTPEEKKTTSSEEGDPQAGEGENPTEETTYVASIGEQGYASLDAAIQAAASGATVTLLDNVELTATLTISNKDITLDVDSNTLTVSVSNGDGIVVENATLTLASSGTGKYVFKCSARNSDGIYVNNTDASTTSTLNLNGDVEINVQASVNSAIHAYATAGNAIVNINGGKITATGSGKQFKAIHVDQNATLNMAGGELDITVDFDSYSDNNDVVGVLIFGNSSKQENCHVVISDGIFKVGGKNAFAQVVQVGMVNGYSENCDVSITGGTVKLEPTENGTGYVYAPYKASYATAAISGGTVTGTVTALVNAYISDVTNDGLTVTGGTFPTGLKDSIEKHLGEGCTMDANGTVSSSATPATGVATVGGVSYDTLEKAFAALSDTAHTLTLNDESAWNTATPVYWKAGDGEYSAAATLVDALTEAYKANAGDITIICRPGADVGKMTHGHVADNLTIYGNNAYVSAGECDLEVDTYKYDRSTGKQVEGNGEYLTKDITINAYELDNLGVWGERHTEFAVNVNLTDCDGKEIDGKTNVQRVYISGTTGVNNITLTGCDFVTKATSVYSNADGEINITDCSFTGAQVPVNFNHKANGEQTLRVSNCEFNACGDKGEWAKFAAPVRFVNSGSGSQTATVDTCTFAGTVGTNGDILIGDGRTGQESNDVSLTVTNTEASIQAQKPGYYNGNETDTSKLGTVTSPASGTLTTSVKTLISGGETSDAIVDEKTLRKALFDAPTDGRQITIKLENDITLDMLYAAENFDEEKLDDNATGDTFNRYKLGVHPTEDDPDHWNPLVTNQSQEARLLYGAYYHMSATDERIARLVVKDGQNIVLDLNGHTIQKDPRATHGDWSNTCTDILANYGTLTITDTSTGTKGTIKGNGYISCQGAVLHNYAGATMNVGAINVDGNAEGMSQGTGQYVVANEGGTLSIDGANIFDTATSASLLVNTTGTMSVKNATLSHPATKTFNVKGGTVEINEGVEITSDTYAIFVKGGTVKLNANVSIKASSEATTPGTLAIEGETATVEKAESVEMEAPAGYKWENNVLVKAPEAKKVAKVGDTDYPTLEEAIAKAEAGQTVTLIADVNTPETTYVVSKDLTIDLNGKTVTGYGYDGVFQIDGANAKVLIKNGNVVAVEKTGSAGKYAMAVWACAENCEVTLEDLTVTQDITHTDDKQMDMIYTSKGKIIINSGSFTSGTPAWTLNCKDAAFKDGSAKIIVNGGEFVGFDPRNNKAEGTGTSFVADGVGVDYGAETSTFTAKANMTAQLLDADDSSVKAYTSLADAITAAEAGQTVTLLDNVTDNIEIATDKNFTLDLNGHTINGGTGTAKATITNYGTVTITDSSTAKTGTIKRDDSGTVGETSYYVIRNIGTMTIEQANVTNNSGYRKTNPSGSMVGSSLICNGGDVGVTLTINGGTFTQMNFLVVKNDALGTLNVTGGTFTSSHSAIQNWFKANITGGEINGQLWTDSWAVGESVGETTIGGNAKVKGEIVMDITGSIKPTLEISGGNFDVTWRITNAAANAGAKPAVSGGTFSSAVAPEYCAEGFEPIANGNGTFGVKEISAAKIGDTEYETLAAAFAAAKDGETIVLLKNSSGDGIVVKNGTFTGKGLIVDFNNHSYTVGGVLVGSSGTASNGFQLNKDNKITFKNGALYGDASVAGDETTNWTGAPAIMIQNYSNLTLEKMTVVGGKETCYTISNNCGDTLIKNSTITAGEASTKPAYQPARAFDVCGFSTYPGATVTVENSTINGAVEISNGNNSKVALTIGKDTTVSGSLVDGGNGDKVTVTKDKSVDVAAPDGYKWVDGETGQTLAKIVMVAEVNGKQYETLQEAIDAAVYGNTVTLLSDTRENVTVTGQTKVITLDLGGHILNGGTVANTPALTVSSKAKLTIVDSSKAQTGTIMREDTAANSGVSSHYVIDIQDTGSQLTFKSGNVKNNSGNADMSKGASLIRIGNDNTTAKPQMFITGGTFTQDNFIAIKVDRGTLTMNGGVINSKNTYAVENWYHTTINDGTINGKVSSWVWSGGNNKDNNLSINGGTIHGDIESVTYDGTETKTAKITINGGVIDGKLLTRDYNKGDITDATKATIGVVAGNFREDPTKFLVEGSTVSKNDEGRYDAVKAYLCKIGEKSYYTMDEALKAVKSGETIVLLRDCSTNKQATSGTKDFTIDLAEFTWNHTGSSEIYSAFEANNENGKITVKNGNVVSNQPIGLVSWDNAGLVFDTVKMTTTGRSGIETNGNNTNDTVTLKNSTLNVPNGFGIYFPSSGTLTIDNSVINAKTMGVQVCSGSLNITGADTKIEVTGDGVEKTENDGAIQDGAAISIVNRTGYKGLGTIAVAEGTFTAKSGNEAVKAYDWSNKEPGEANFTASDKVAISGGTYSTPVAANLCAEGFVPKDNGNGTYGVQPDGNVAEIGSVKYTSLDEALKAAKDRETVKLLKDVEATQVLVTKGTLDLNGKTLKVSYFMSFSDVIDSTEGNGLIETGVQSFFTTNNSHLPLRDSAANGYRLFSYQLNKLGIVKGSPTAFWFNIVFGGEKAYSLLNTAGHNADLFIPMQIGSGNEWQYIKMNQSTLRKWTTPILNGTAPSKCGYYVNITGLDTLTSGTVLTLKTSIRSCGVEKLSDDSLTYTVK